MDILDREIDRVLSGCYYPSPSLTPTSMTVSLVTDIVPSVSIVLPAVVVIPPPIVDDSSLVAVQTTFDIEMDDLLIEEYEEIYESEPLQYASVYMVET